MIRIKANKIIYSDKNGNKVNGDGTEIEILPEARVYDYIVQVLIYHYFKFSHSYIQEISKGNLRTNCKSQLGLKRCDITWNIVNMICDDKHFKGIVLDNILFIPGENYYELLMKKISFKLKLINSKNKNNPIRLVDEISNIDRNAIYYPFIAFYEKYREDMQTKINNENFYDFSIKETNSGAWTLAQVIRNSISHEGEIKYINDYKYKLVYNLNLNSVSISTLNFFKNILFDEDKNNKKISEYFGSLELILLMIEMENELDNEII